MKEEAKDDFEESGISDNDDYPYRRDTAQHWGVLHPLVLAFRRVLFLHVSWSWTVLLLLFFLVCLLQTNNGEKWSTSEIFFEIDPDRLPNLHQAAGKLEIRGRPHDEFVSSLDIITQSIWGFCQRRQLSGMPFWRNLTMNLKLVLETEVESSVLSCSPQTQRNNQEPPKWLVRPPPQSSHGAFVLESPASIRSSLYWDN